MGTDNTSLGDRMKWYESRYTNEIFMPMLPVIARIDGRAFHTFTKGLERPYDERLSRLMIDVTKLLVEETNARCGYTQSDEITLVYFSESWDSEIFFGGKLQKMASVIGSQATAFFNYLLPQRIPEKVPKNALQAPVFDNRVFQVPADFEAVNCLVWREQDATRNSVQMAARSYYSHNEVLNKNNSELQEMMFQKGRNWNDYPTFFKRGTYVRRRTIERPFTAEELRELPPKHAARSNPGLMISRSVVMEEDFPPLTQITNREDVIVRGADPILRTEP